MTPSETSKQSVHVVALGGCSALGTNIGACTTGVFSKRRAFELNPTFCDSQGAPIRLATAPWLPSTMPPLKRFENLMLKALAPTTMTAMALHEAGARVALALVISAPRVGLPLNLEGTLLQLMHDNLPLPFCTQTTFRTGASGGLAALRTAVDAIQSGAFDACLVVAVDSAIEQSGLRWREAQQSLQGLGDAAQTFSRIPGEGAAALLLTRASLAQQLELPNDMTFLSFGEAYAERGHPDRYGCADDTLAMAIDQCLAALPPPFLITDLYGDLNGERPRIREYLLIEPRIHARLIANSAPVNSSDCWGDPGAAHGLLQVALAARYHALGYARGAVNLVWAGDNCGQRAALIALSPPPQRTDPAAIQRPQTRDLTPPQIPLQSDI